MLPAFGAGLLIHQLSAEKIAAYEEQRIETVSAWTVRNELTVLRHMLRLAHRKWNYLDRMPEIELPTAPRGRTRYLTEHEIQKLLASCAASRNQHLGCMVMPVINTGMRKSEILNFTWERIELDTDLGFNAHIMLYETKNGEPRGVPLNQAACSALSALEPARHRHASVAYSSERTVRAGGRFGPPSRRPSNGRDCPTSGSTICGTRRRVTWPCVGAR